MLIKDLLESKQIVEVKLMPKELLKHDYLDRLIDRIEKGEELVIEPGEVEKFGASTVVLDPASADILRAWKIEGPISKAPMLQIADSDETISASILSKTNVRSSLNAGIMSEGVLGAALVAKFSKVGKEINASDVIKVLNGIKDIVLTKGTSSVQGTYITKIKNKNNVSDNIKFVLKLAGREFEHLTKASAGDSTISKLINSAVSFVNNSAYSIPKALDLIADNANGNQIDVVTDGVSENKMTKADLTLKINGKTIDLISLKAGSVKQFGQSSGGKSFATLINDFFNVKLGTLPDEIIELSATEAKNKELAQKIAQQNYDVIRNMYLSKINPQIQKQIKTTKAKKDFIVNLVNGISKHMTGDEKIHILKLSTSGEGGYSLLKLDKKKLNKYMEGLEFSIVYYNQSNTFKIMAVPTDSSSELFSDLNGEPGLLLQIRSKFDNAYIRNIVEMGKVLENLITLEKRSETVGAAKTAKPITKLRARFEPKTGAVGREAR